LRFGSAWRFLLKSALLESQSPLIDHRRLVISKLPPLPFENGGERAYLRVMATELELSGVLTFSPISTFHQGD